MHRRLSALVILVSACSVPSTATTLPGGIVPSQTTVSTEAPAQVSETVQTTASSSVFGEVDDPLDDNAIAFVAALEEALAGTSFEGAVLESPELFIATAEVICVRLDNGDGVNQILVDYIEGLRNTDGEADTVSENEAAMVAGGVLGASLELFCPQHRGLVEDDS